MTIVSAYSFESGGPAAEGLTALGSAACSTTQHRTGAYALRCNPVSTSTGYITVNLDNYVHFGLYIATMPSVARTIAGGAASGDRLVLNANGTLSIYNGGTLLGTSSALSTGLWYWVGWRVASSGGGSVVALQINSVDQFSCVVAGTANSILGCQGTEASAIDIYFDDVVMDDSGFLTSHKVDIALPISDNTRTGVTAGAGGTSNLWEAINNTPPAGVASANETNTSNIRFPASTTCSYIANLETYTTLGVGASDTIEMVRAIWRHGEDIATNSKTGTFVGTTNPTFTDNADFGFGNDSGAHGIDPTSALWVTTYGPIKTSSLPGSGSYGTSPTIRIDRASQARVGCIDFMGLLVVWKPPSATYHNGELLITGTGTIDKQQSSVLISGALSVTGTGTLEQRGMFKVDGALAVTGSGTLEQGGIFVHDGALAVTGSGLLGGVATTPAYVQEVGRLSSNAAATHNIPFTVAPATGSHLIAFMVCAATRSINTISDTQGNAWTVRRTVQNNGGSLSLFIAECYVEHALTTSDTLDVTLSASQGLGAVIHEYSGGDSTGWYDVSSGEGGGASGVTTFDSLTTGTTAIANESYVGVLATSATAGTITPTQGGLTSRATVTPADFVRTLYPYDKQLAVTGTQQFSGSYTSTRQNSALVATFRGGVASGLVGQRVINGALDIVGSATLEARGAQTQPGALDITGTGTLEQTGQIPVNGALDVTGTGTLAQQASVLISGALTLPSPDITTVTSDTFTVGSNVTLVGRTPDVGSAWQALVSFTYEPGSFTVVAATDLVQYTPTGTEAGSSHEWIRSGGSRQDSTASVKFTPAYAHGLFARYDGSGSPGTGITKAYRIYDDGTNLRLYRHSSGSAVQIASVAHGLGASTWRRMKLDVANLSPTTLRARIWNDGSSEPGGWLIDTSDNTAVNQASGANGISASGADGDPDFARFDDFLVEAVGTPVQSALSQSGQKVRDIALDVTGTGALDQRSSVLIPGALDVTGTATIAFGGQVAISGALDLVGSGMFGQQASVAISGSLVLPTTPVGDIAIAAHGTPPDNDQPPVTLYARKEDAPPFGVKARIYHDLYDDLGYGSNHTVLVLGYGLTSPIDPLAKTDLGSTWMAEWQVRFEVWGDPSDVTIRAKAWITGGSEPPTWLSTSVSGVSRTDVTGDDNLTIDSVTGIGPIQSAIGFDGTTAGIDEGALNVTGTGTLTQQASVLISGALDVTGTATLDQAASVLFGGALTVTGTGAVTFGGQVAIKGQLAVTGSGTLGQQASAVRSGALVLPGAGQGSATVITLQDGWPFAPVLNEIQRVTVVASGGTFHLSSTFPQVWDFGDFAWDVSAADMETALETTIDEGDQFTVTKVGNAYTVEFSGNAVGSRNWDPLVADGSNLVGAPSVQSAIVFDGTIAAVRDGALDVTGSGTLAQQASVVISGALAISGSGAIDQTGENTVVGALDISGSGTLEATPGAGEFRDGALDAAGSATFAQSGELALATNLDLTAAGTLAQTASVLISGALAVSGSGDLGQTGSTAGTDEGEISIIGTGDLVQQSSVLISAALDTAGSSILAQQASVAISGALDIAGSATLGQQSSILVSGALDATGTGALGATASVALPGALDVAGTGELAQQASILFDGALATTGTGTLAAGGLLAISGILDIAGSGNLGQQASVLQSGALDVAGTGSLGQSASGDQSGALGLSGTALLEAAATMLLGGGLSVTASADLSLRGAQDHVGAMAITGSGILEQTAGTGGTVKDGALAVDGTATIALGGERSVPGAFAASGTGTLGSAGAVIFAGAFARTGSGTISLGPAITTTGALSVTGTGALDGRGSNVQSGAASWSGDGTIDGSGIVTTGTGLSVAGSATLALAPTVLANGRLLITGAGAFDAAGQRALAASWSLVGSGTFTLTGAEPPNVRGTVGAAYAVRPGLGATYGGPATLGASSKIRDTVGAAHD